MTSKLKRENNASSSFYKNKFLERQIHINLFYYLYVISSKNHLATDCKKNGEYQEIENTGHMHCPVLLSFLYRTKSQNTGLSGLIPDTWQPYLVMTGSAKNK